MASRCQALLDSDGSGRAESTLLERQHSGSETSTSRPSGPEISTSRPSGPEISTSRPSGSETSTSRPSPDSTANGNGNGNGLPTKLEQEAELAVLTELPVKEQGYESLVAWVGAAMAFGGGIWYTQGPEKAQEFFAGYLLEQSLSVDNLFVFILVFNYFKTPPSAQKKVLTWGIASAAVLRAIFIVAGVELIEVFEPLLLFFSAILIYSSYKIIVAEEDEEDEEDLTDNAVVTFCRSFIPTSDHYDGDNFWTTPEAAEAAATDATDVSPSSPPADALAPTSAPSLDATGRIATPLLLTLAVVELSDVLFAVDSIPAVFGVTLDPFIIYSSNMFAILSLRALYGFVANVMSELRFLDKAVAVVLGFIGVKMVLGFADVNIPTDMSLLVVGLVLGGGVAASLLLPEPAEMD